jgi:hypothetical protein
MTDVAMRRVSGDEVPEADDPPGVFCWRTQGPGNGTPGGRYLLYVCPRDKGFCGVPIAPNHLANGASWHHDGNDDAPTLTPSVNCVGGCGWHGWVRGGVMTDA